MSDCMQQPMVVFPGVPQEKVTEFAVACAAQYVQQCAERERPGPTGEARELPAEERRTKAVALALLRAYWDERADFLAKVQAHRAHCEEAE